MKYLLIVGIMFLMGTGCEKSTQVPSNQIPEWLQEEIEEAESAIISDPKSIQKYCAWIRYEYQGKVYFEYSNPLSSYYLHLYTENGEAPKSTELTISDYMAQRCCAQIVWKGPKYVKIR